MTTTPPRDVDVRVLLEGLAEDVHAIRELLEHQHAASASADPRPAALLAAIATALHDLDLEFGTDEVIAIAHGDHDLAAALDALHVTTSAHLGIFFRDIKGHDHDGLMVLRDGRGW